MERDFSGSGLNHIPKAGSKNKTGDYICCVCGDKATNYRSVRLKLSFSSDKIISDFMEPPMSATLVEFSSRGLWKKKESLDAM